MSESQAVQTPPRVDAGVRALTWWRLLNDKSTGDPGVRARLRRARTPLDALAIPTAVSLVRRVSGRVADAPDWRVRAAVDLARVLAHVKLHDPEEHPMRAAGWKRFAGDRKESEAGDDRPRLSEARFKRLLQVGDGEEKVTAFIRLVQLLDGKVNVAELSRDFLRWNAPEIGDRVRERWAFFYYAAPEAAPPEPETTPLTAAEDDDE